MTDIAAFGRGMAAAALMFSAAAHADGAACPANFIEIPPALRAASDANATTAPFAFEADRIDTGDATVALNGDARIIRGGRGLFAERIVYARATARATAAGDVVFYTASHGGARLTADEMTVDLDTWTGQARAVGIAIARRAPENRAPSAEPSPAKIEIHARATADSVQFAGDESQRLQRVTLTACAPGNRDVELRAREIVLDHAAGIGRAKAMTVRVKGAPVFYFPAATFPIDEARKSGFLFPAAGYAGDSGAMVEAPYYFNLAPNYDATVTPRLWSRRGAQLAGKFRYLTRHGRGQLDGELLPSDNNYDGDDGDRYALRARHEHRPGPGWRARLDWNSVSDADYTRDFSSEIDVVAAHYIERAARLDYAAGHRRLGDLKFSAQTVAYESNDRAIARAARPYHRLPQLDLAWQSAFGFLRAGVDAQYADFRHDHCADGDGDAALPCGSRLRVKPWLSAPLRRSFGYIEPRLSWQSIRYSLDQRAAGMRASPSVEAPIFSLDGGLYFDRRLRLGGAEFLHTLEPRLRYVNIPTRRAQRAFPDFDTAVAGGGSFAQLFRDNRFFGGDRIGDTEHVAAGVTSRVLDRGRQRLRLSLGQIIYLQDRKITAADANAAPETWDTSGWFAAAAAALPKNWRADVFARAHDGDSDNTLAWFHAAAQYHGRAGRRAALAYTFHDTVDTATVDTAQTEQLSAAFAAPVGNRWRITTGGAYSLETDEFHAATVGVEFDGCCWAVRAAASRALDGDGEHKNRFRLTFELDGLGGINSAP